MGLCLIRAHPFYVLLVWDLSLDVPVADFYAVSKIPTSHSHGHVAMSDPNFRQMVYLSVGSCHCYSSSQGQTELAGLYYYLTEQFSLTVPLTFSFHSLIERLRFLQFKIFYWNL